MALLISPLFKHKQISKFRAPKLEGGVELQLKQTSAPLMLNQMYEEGRVIKEFSLKAQPAFILDDKSFFPYEGSRRHSQGLQALGALSRTGAIQGIRYRTRKSFGPENSYLVCFNLTHHFIFRHCVSNS